MAPARTGSPLNRLPGTPNSLAREGLNGIPGRSLLGGGFYESAYRCSIRPCCWASTSSSARSTVWPRTPRAILPTISSGSARTACASRWPWPASPPTTWPSSWSRTSSRCAASRADDSDRVFLHRGIAARQFQRAFMLADGIEVTGARLDNGLLSIDLVRPVQEPRIRTIRIDAGERRQRRTSNTIDITARRVQPR